LGHAAARDDFADAVVSSYLGYVAQVIEFQ
jgi:hypothetical protein